VTESELRPPSLIVTGGPQDGATISCNPGSGLEILGSGEQSSVRITMGNVAPVHAQLQWDGQQLFLEDAGSETGTYVNGERIMERRAVVEGDRLFLGPPGSTNSAGLLVCAATDAPSFGGELQLDAPDIGLAPSEPLVLDPPEPAGGASPFEPAPPISSQSAADAGAERPLPLIPPPTGAIRKPSKADYNTEIPSIVPNRVREPLALPGLSPKKTAPMPPARKPPVRRKASIAVSPAVLGGVAAAVLVIGAAVAYFLLHKVPPVLASVAPPKIEPGGTLALKGENFAAAANQNTVYFGDLVADVLSASATDISVRVPADAKPGELVISVKTKGGRSNTVNCIVFIAPHVASLSPEVAMPGQEITLTGQNLNSQPPTVVIGGIRGAVVDAQPTSIKVRIPPEIMAVEGRTIQVTVQVGTETSKAPDLLLGHLPLVATVEPATGAAGSRIVVKGRGFAPTASENTVTFGEKRALVLAAGPTELTVAVPGSEVPGSQLTLPLRVNASGTVSSPASFVLTRSTAGYFLPRFFALPVTDHPGHDHVYVATDLGPLLVLSAKGGAGLAERGAGVADALNGLADAAAAGQTVKVEARESPVGCVGTGNAACLVTATADDAAGYDEAWCKTKGARSTPRALAVHWAALIDDYLTMFVAKQRPFRTLETSPRGKTLLELYGEATRRSGPGAGIPIGLVSPLPARLEADLRELALVLPGETQAKGAGAIEGLWTGTLEEASGTREIKIRFKLRGAKLEGTLSTSTGDLSMDRPLEDLTYEKSGIQFTARVGGDPRHFSGSLQRGQLSGVVSTGTSKETNGRFTLSFVE
jgi:hypothetical protein